MSLLCAVAAVATAHRGQRRPRRCARGEIDAEVAVRGRAWVVSVAVFTAGRLPGKEGVVKYVRLLDAVASLPSGRGNAAAGRVVGRRAGLLGQFFFFSF